METAAIYKVGNATVRIHGSPDLEKVKAATTTYLKKAETMKKRKLKAAQALQAAERKGA